MTAYLYPVLHPVLQAEILYPEKLQQVAVCFPSFPVGIDLPRFGFLKIFDGFRQSAFEDPASILNLVEPALMNR